MIYNASNSQFNFWQDSLEKFWSAIFAGIFIGLAGFGFLVDKTLGIFLFIFGLASVVSYGTKLFTGTAGFVEDWQEVIQLIFILIGNILGCFIISLIANYSGYAETIQTNAVNILNGRLTLGWFNCGIEAIGCGILMTTAVTFARQGKEIGNWIPLLFAVPLFIHCGFPHCIADVFYYLCIPFTNEIWNSFGAIIGTYASIVFGNFIGCNIWKLFIK